MSFLTTYYPKKLNFEINGSKIFLRPPDYKDWNEWSDLREKNEKYLRPWEPSWLSLIHI